MLRRPSIGLLVAVVALLPAAAACDGGDDDVAIVQVAFLRAVPSEGQEPLLDQLRAGGFVPGESLEFVQAEPLGETLVEPEAIEARVREWLDAGVDLIFAFSSSGAAAAAELTSNVPILFLVNDPRAVGLVDDEDAPSGNLTGATFRVPADRTLDLAVAGIPDFQHVGILVPDADPAGPPARDAMVAAAEELGLQATTESFAAEDDIERAVTALADAGAGAIVVVNTPTSVRASVAIEPVATAAGLPIVANTTFTQGATFVLEPDTAELLAQLGRQGVRILAGDDPSEIPVEDPRQFRIVLDRGQAAELDLPPFPDELVQRADEVRE